MGCDWYDEYNQCCMWERMEKIFRYPWEEKAPEECFEDMP